MQGCHCLSSPTTECFGRAPQCKLKVRIEYIANHSGFRSEKGSEAWRTLKWEEMGGKKKTWRRSTCTRYESRICTCICRHRYWDANKNGRLSKTMLCAWFENKLCRSGISWCYTNAHPYMCMTIEWGWLPMAICKCTIDQWCRWFTHKCS